MSGLEADEVDGERATQRDDLLRYLATKSGFHSQSHIDVKEFVNKSGSLDR